MSRTALLVSILISAATPSLAGTFTPAPYVKEERVDVLTRAVANEKFSRDLLGAPYATVVVANVDVYDRFPYVEARYFQIVTDPAWNRLLMGEIGRTPLAYDGSAGAFGRLSAPRGLSSDARGRVYVADAGNDRVLVFQAVSEFDRMSLRPLYAVTDLNDPYGVAYSDGGTPFDASDDRLVVANTGRNDVRLYSLSDNGASLVASIGDLGSGANRFAGPMAVTFGRRNGAHTEDVYVSDAHNGRIVHLRDAGGSLEWVGSVSHGLGLVTSLDADHFGNLYAAAPQAGKVVKHTRSLIPVAVLTAGIQGPRAFHIPFANVTDHRGGGAGVTSRAGQGSGVLVEEWGGEHGLRLLDLGVEMTEASVLDEESAAVRVTLTDQATVTAEITDPRSGQLIARRDAGLLESGSQTIRFLPGDYVSAWSLGEYRLSLKATSTYDDSRTSQVTTTLMMKSAGAPLLPARLTSLGAAPNPFNPTTTIRFVVPDGPARAYSLRIYDVGGGLVRALAEGPIGAGLQVVQWDGRSDRGEVVGSGIYLYRIEVDQETITGKMVLVK
jgi:hypothetical protein